MCVDQDIYPTLTITGDIVNLAIFGNDHRADHLKCIFCMFQHVVVVQYNKQCFYWIPHTRKYVCRHQDIYPALTSTRDILNLVIFGSGQAIGAWTNLKSDNIAFQIIREGPLNNLIPLMPWWIMGGAWGPLWVHGLFSPECMTPPNRPCY